MQSDKSGYMLSGNNRYFKRQFSYLLSGRCISLKLHHPTIIMLYIIKIFTNKLIFDSFSWCARGITKQISPRLHLQHYITPNYERQARLHFILEKFPQLVQLPFTSLNFPSKTIVRFKSIPTRRRSKINNSSPPNGLPWLSQFQCHCENSGVLLFEVELVALFLFEFPQVRRARLHLHYHDNWKILLFTAAHEVQRQRALSLPNEFELTPI